MPLQAEDLYTRDCIRTVSGIYMNVFEPTPEMVCIEDIAHALSKQCRFGGHLPRFYSVAQHSVACMNNAEPAERLAALLHDASEAYLLDIPSPIKKRLANYNEIEEGLMRVIAEKFGFGWPLAAAVKDLDRKELEWEWHALMLGAPKYKYVGWPPHRAKLHFLNAFKTVAL